MTRVAIVVPTPDATGEPARTALATAAQTTAHLGASVHPVVDRGPGFSFARSINKGFAAAPEADAWVLLNDDCFMDDGWLDAMLATAARHPLAGQVGAVLRYRDGGAIQHAGGFIAIAPFEFALEAARHGAPLWALRAMARGQRFFFAHHHGVRRGMRLDFLTAACVLVTRACRDAVGVFDERYPMGAEDVDYGLRTLEGGLELALARGATGVHLEGATSGHMSPAKRRSVDVFHDRWPVAEVRRLTRGRSGIVD